MENVGLIFGRRVRALRLARKLTQEELGHSSGIDYKHLSAIERGAKTASFDSIGKLAEALGVECWKLFLPDHRTTANMDKEIAGVVTGASQFSQRDIEEFFRSLQAAVKKLDRKSNS